MSVEHAARTPPEAWDEIVVRALKANEVALITYVPDKVLAPLIKRLHADDFFTVLCPARRSSTDSIVLHDHNPRAGVALAPQSAANSIPD